MITQKNGLVARSSHWQWSHSSMYQTSAVKSIYEIEKLLYGKQIAIW